MTTITEKYENTQVVYVDPNNTEAMPSDIDIVCCFPKETKYLVELSKKSTNIKWVHSVFAGVDLFIKEKETFERLGCTLTNSKGSFSDSLGEYCMGAILYWEKKIPEFIQTNKDREWKFCPQNMLKGKSLAIIGYGNIGIEVAKRAKLGFGMKVLAVKNRVEVETGKEFTDGWYGLKDLDTPLKQADYIVNILPSTSETADFFDLKRFKLMKPETIFINIGRGATVNEEDLFTALNNNIIRAAACDVFKVEPMKKENPLYSLESKMLISNHSADYLNDGLDNQKNSFDQFGDMIGEFIDNGRLKNIINFDLGY
jgi:D-2-hydroxyacid dehydrogenase (NADP+)